MAKSKSFFGLRRGSTKSLTFSVLNGQQVTKDRVYGGKNPRSLAQMIQRMCMATSSAAYAEMKQIVDHSFEGISYGANTMAKFLSVNTKALKDAYAAGNDNFAFNPYGDRGLKVGAYIMARGTASALPASAGSLVKAAHVVTGSISSGKQETISVKDTLAAFGLNVGELATFCFMYAKDGSNDNWGFGFIRVTALGTTPNAVTPEQFKDYVKFESNIGTVTVTRANGAGTLTFSVTLSDDASELTDLAQCLIHSVQSNGAWLRSNATLDVPQRVDVQPSAADALATYPVGESYVLNGGEIE